MAIIDYLLIAVVAMAAIYTDYRLFMGRQNTFPQDDGRAEAERFNAFNFES